MILSACPFETGLAQVMYHGNGYLGLSKPKAKADPNYDRRPDYEVLIRNLVDVRDNQRVGNPKRGLPIVFETELIDTIEHNKYRFAVQELVETIIGSGRDHGYPELTIGVFDQAGGHGFMGYHPDHPNHVELKKLYLDTVPIGNTAFGPLYLNDNRLELVKARGTTWFQEVIAGCRAVREQHYEDQVYITIHHTTFRNVEGETITPEMQEEAYIGDDAWRTLCGSGKVLWWTHGTTVKWDRPLKIAKEMQEASGPKGKL